MPRKSTSKTSSELFADASTVKHLQEKMDIHTGTRLLSHPEFVKLMTKGGQEFGVFRSYQKVLSLAQHIGKTENSTPYLPVKYTRMTYGRYMAKVEIEMDSTEHWLPCYQGMWREIRAACAKAYYSDLDISNAQPTILLNVCEQNDIDCPMLIEYIENREQWMQMICETFSCPRDTAKNLFIREMFGGSVAAWCKENQFDIAKVPDKIMDFDNELKLLSLEVLNLDCFQAYKEWFKTVYVPYRATSGKPLQKKEMDRSIFAILLQDLERQCLDVMYDLLVDLDYQIGGLIHDGLHVHPAPSAEHIRACTRAIKKALGFELELKVKEFDIPEIYLQDASAVDVDKRPDDWDQGTQIYPYSLTKKYWEMNVVKLSHHSAFLYMDLDSTNTYQIWKKEHLITNYEHLACLVTKKSEKGGFVAEKKQFIQEWLKDPEIRHLRYMDFIPPPREVPANTFNLWTPFEAQKHESSEEAVRIVHEVFIDFVTKLFNNREQSVKYLLDWVAQIVQRPDQKIGVSYILRGEQGCGKNALVDMVRYIIGEAKFLETADPAKHIFDRFTSHKAGKILIAINEASGKDVHMHDDKLKDLITSTTILMEKKGVDAVVLQDFARYIFTSNNDNPVKTPAGERRFVTEEVSKAFHQDRKYFAAYYAYLHRGDVKRALLDFFMSRDISQVDWIADRPVTDATKQAYIMNLAPEERFIADLTVREAFKKTSSITLTSEKLFDDFMDWLCKARLDSYQTTLPKFGLKMSNFARVDSPKVLEGFSKSRSSANATYTLHVSALLQTLVKKGWVFPDDIPC